MGIQTQQSCNGATAFEADELHDSHFWLFISTSSLSQSTMRSGQC